MDSLWKFQHHRVNLLLKFSAKLPHPHESFLVGEKITNLLAELRRPEGPENEAPYL